MNTGTARQAGHPADRTPAGSPRTPLVHGAAHADRRRPRVLQDQRRGPSPRAGGRGVPGPAAPPRALGAPDMRLATLPSRYAALLDDLGRDGADAPELRRGRESIPR